MNKQQLAAKIWESANQMRSKIEANEYKDYILGFIFYKYLSDKEVRFALKEGSTKEDIKTFTEEDTETVEYFKSNLGYFIGYENLFSTWLELGSDFDVSNVRVALSAFSRHINPSHKKVYEGIFKTLETGLSKLGENSNSQTKAISELLYLIKDIPMEGKQDYDVLGFIYEYLISMFAANAGKKAGEFYTPHEVSLLMSEIVAHHLKDRKEIQIYDPTSGSGSLLINIGHSVAKHMDDENNIKYFAQELKQNTYNLTRMNLIMRGILPDNIITRNGDTLEDDWPYFDESDPVATYDPLYVDAVVSNPPYSQKWDSSNKEADPRYARFGIAPKSKADYAFLLHDLYHIKPDGVMTIVLPHGVLFRGGEEGQIRKNLIEGNHIDTIIGLPANIFFGTGIPTVILVLKQKREHTDILVVDASKGFAKVGKNNMLRASDIKRISDTVINRLTIDKFSKVVSRDEVRQNDYNLNIPRYVDSSEKAETYDIYASMFGGIPVKELEDFNHYWQAFPGLKETIFKPISEAYVALAVDNLKEALEQHKSVQSYYAKFTSAFNNFAEFLKTRLLNNFESIKVNKEEEVLSINIFERLNHLPLIDKYTAFQLLHDDWDVIAVDLEMIQTEGYQAITQVDPNLVIKKKGTKEVEVQEGWKGHIIPFELVQNTLLRDSYKVFKQLENKLLAIPGEIGEIFESLSEEEMDSEVVNDNNDGFVKSQVAKEAKDIKKEFKNLESLDEESIEAKIIRVDHLFEEEKTLKKEVKIESDKLHLMTKETIENLSPDEVLYMLEAKWILPLLESLNQLPVNIIAEMSNIIQRLADKYETTFEEVEKEIRDTEQQLASMIDDLTGNEFDMKGLSELKLLLNGE